MKRSIPFVLAALLILPAHAQDAELQAYQALTACTQEGLDAHADSQQPIEEIAATIMAGCAAHIKAIESAVFEGFAALGADREILAVQAAETALLTADSFERDIRQRLAADRGEDLQAGPIETNPDCLALADRMLDLIAAANPEMADEPRDDLRVEMSTDFARSSDIDCTHLSTASDDALAAMFLGMTP